MFADINLICIFEYIKQTQNNENTTENQNTKKKYHQKHVR